MRIQSKIVKKMFMDYADWIVINKWLIDSVEVIMLNIQQAD